MRPPRHLGPLLSAPRRGLATSYSGRIVRSDPSGRALAVEVDPPDLLRDPRGYALPRRDLICRAAHILLSPSSADPFLDLSDYLQTLTLTLTPAEASEILKSLRRPDRALAFFRFAAALPGFRHDCFTYNRLLSILARAAADDEARRLVDEMERDGIRGNISTVNILIGIFGAGELGRCLELVKKWGLRLNGYTYKCLVQAHLRYRDAEGGFRVYEDMRKRGYKLDIFAYNMLLDALAKADMVCGSFSRPLPHLNLF